MNLLLLNWRDPWHPKSGGAEVMTLRLLQHLRRGGWNIEWFSARYPDARPDEMRDGIRYVRRGSQVSVHYEAFHHYRKTGGFDIVVDEINTIPFFAQAYFKVPVVALVYQLAREVWFYEAPLPLAILGYLAEPIYLQPYRNTPIATISKSSADSFTSIGLRGTKCIIPISCDEEPRDAVALKAQPRDIIVVSRLTRSKRIHHALEAASILSKRGWRGRLHVVGSGDQKYLKMLQARAQALMPGRVVFHGRVSDETRCQLLTAASAIWMMSRREGWGLVITEAARRSTPAVVYDSPGLRDAVINGQTGFVTKPSPRSLADATQRLFEGDFPAVARNALENSLEFSWHRSGVEFERFLTACITQSREPAD